MMPSTFAAYLKQYPSSQQFPEPLSLENAWDEVFAPKAPMVSGGLNLRVPQDAPVGIKYDSDKPKWSLMPKGVISQVVEVMTIGAKKYTPDNWMHVEPTRYYDAMHRHVDAWRNGETKDQETGKHHLAHAICCLIFMLWHDQKPKS